MANPIITNVGVVTRHGHLALASQVILDGADLPADAKILKGTVLFKKGNGKYRVKLVSDTAVANTIRILQDDVVVEATKDFITTAYFCGFFRLSTMLAVTPGLLEAALTTAAGFQKIEADEMRLW